MAGKNITIAGATFNAVPSIDVPVSGGGTASFVEISDTTAQAADVAQGKYFYDAQGVKTEGTASGGGGVDVEALSVTQNGTYTAPTGKAYSPVTVNVPSGGGGASNIVTGTFTGTTEGAAMDIDLPYTGSGYPIAVIIYPTGGMAGSSDYWNLVKRYATAVWSGAKRNADVAPQYTGANYDNDSLSVVTMFKNSTSISTSYSSSYAQNQTIYKDTAAESTNPGCVHIRSKTKMSVYIAGTRGFAANIEYTYHVIYSE